MKKFFIFSSFFFLGLTFLFFTLGHLGRMSYLGQQVNGYVYEITAVLAVVSIALSIGLKQTKSIAEKYSASFLFLGFLLVAYFLDIGNYSFESNAVAFLYYLRLVFYFSFFFFLTAFFIQYKKKTTFFFYGIAVLAYFTAFTGFVQYIFYPELRNLIYLGWDPHLYRMFGTFFDTSVAAAIYTIFFYFFYFFGNTFIKNRYVVYASMAVFFVCIVLTFSRTTYVIFLGSLFYLLIRNKQYLKIGLLLVTFIFLLILIPKPFGEGVNLARTFSIESRIQDYADGIEIGKKKIVFGYGYNRLRPVKKEFNLISSLNYDVTHAGASFHSSFLTIFVTSGIIGLSLFIWTLLELGKRGGKALFFIAYLSFLSFADNVILHPFILFLLMLILSFDYVVNRPSRISR